VSSNGGETFSEPATVVTQVTSAREGVPSLAVDQSDGPFRDRLYLAWSDYQSGRGEILLSYSLDRGKHWSRPLVVSDDLQRAMPAAGPHNTMPTLAVSRDGVVGLTWYDRREHPDNLGYWVRFVASVDGGESFSPSVRVSDVPASFDRNRVPIETFARGKAISLRPGTWPGHTAGLTATTDGLFHPFWVDNRTHRFQIWTTTVHVQGRAMLNGSPDLADLTDLTSKVQLNVSEPIIDWARMTATVEVSLTNRALDTVVGPVKLRALSLRTPVGAHTVAAINADNGETENGAIWDLTGTLTGGRLGPGQRSGTKIIRWKWTHLSQAQFDQLIQGYSLIDQEIKVLGRVEK